MPKLKITAARDGFRRAGRAWSAAGDVIDTKDFTREQLEVLKKEPMLEISEPTAADEVKAPDEGAAKGKK